MSLSERRFFHLTQSISKAVNALETPVKEKHVRSTIIGTFHERGATTYWVVVLRLPLQDNRIVAWKFCIVTHKILREGHQNCVVHSQRHIPMMQDLGKLWVHLREGYGRLIQAYCSLLICKLKFHDRNPRIPGSLQLSPGDLDVIAENDVNNYFQLSVEIFDYQDAVIQLQTSIFESLDNTRTNSMTVSGQCRLSALVACVQESSVLYDAAVQLLFRLHNALPSDTLTGHRQRFKEQFTALRSFYRTARAMQYFRNLITIPELPDKPPNFLIQSELGAYVAPVALVPDPEPLTLEEQQLVDTSEASSSLLDIHSDIPDSASQVDQTDILLERDRLIEHLQLELARLRSEIQQHSMEHRQTMALMQEKNSLLDSELTSTKTELNRTQLEMRHVEQQLAGQISKHANVEEVQAKATTAEEKFQKLKTAYTQMRDEHIALIRQKAEVEKQAATAARIFAQKEASFAESLSKTEENVLQKSSAEMEEMETRAREAALAEIERREEIVRRQVAEECLLREARAKEELTAELESKYASVVEETIARVRREEHKAGAEALEKVKTSLEREKFVLIEDLSRKEGMKLEEAMLAVKTELETAERTKMDLEESLQRKEDLITELNEKIQQLAAEKQSLEFKFLRSEDSRLTMECDVQEALQQQETIREEAEIEMKLLQESQKLQDRKAAARLLHTASGALGSTSGTGARLAALDAASVLEEELSGEEAQDSGVAGAVALASTLACAAADVTVDHNLGESVVNASRDLLAVTRRLCEEGSSSADRDSLKTALAALRAAIESLPASPTATAENVDEVMTNMDKEIEEAASKIQQMLEESRARDTGLKLEVSESVLDSCTALMAAVRRLVTSARVLQTMFGKTTSGRDPYARNPLWAEGLISAARAVAAAARLLLTTADDAIKGKGKISGVAGAAQEVAGSTARLVIASRVRVPPGTPALTELGAASGAVSSATATLVAAARAAATRDEEMLDEEALSAMSSTAARRLEMEARVRALELETSLEAERRRLAALRRRRYRLEQGQGDGEDDWEKIENGPQ